MSLDALVNLDTDLAAQVCATDDTVDEMHRAMYTKVKTCISENPDDTDCLLYYLSVSRNLERIADHATNIAQDVMYMIKGEIVRHTMGTNSPKM